MLNRLSAAWSVLMGRNSHRTPSIVIVDQLNEVRPLPMGRKDFDEWSDRIIGGALIPGGEDDLEFFHNSQRFALANMIMHLGPTESHKPDAFFVHSLRKFAINQVADSVRRELKAATDARLKAKEEIEKTEEQKASEALAAETLKRSETIRLV